MFETTHCVQTSEIDKYYPNFLPPLNGPHTAKLCFSLVLNAIWGKITENWLSQNEAQKYSEILYIATIFVMG